MPELVTLLHTHTVHFHSDACHPFADTILSRLLGLPLRGLSDVSGGHICGLWLMTCICHAIAAALPHCLCPTPADTLAPFAVTIQLNLLPRTVWCRLWLLFPPSPLPWPLIGCPCAIQLHPSLWIVGPVEKTGPHIWTVYTCWETGGNPTFPTNFGIHLQCKTLSLPVIQLICSWCMT